MNTKIMVAALFLGLLGCSTDGGEADGVAEASEPPDGYVAARPDVAGVAGPDVSNALPKSDDGTSQDFDATADHCVIVWLQCSYDEHRAENCIPGDYEVLCKYVYYEDYYERVAQCGLDAGCDDWQYQHYLCWAEYHRIRSDCAQYGRSGSESECMSSVRLVEECLDDY